MRNGRRAGACAAVALAGVALAACGGGDAPKPLAATVAQPAGPKPDPCTLLTRADLATVFRGTAPKGKRTGAVCVYQRKAKARATAVRPPREVNLAVTFDSTSETRTPTLAENRRISLGHGASANTRVTVKANTQTGAQASAGFTMRHRQVGFLLSDSAKTTGSLIDPVVRLARRVAARLAR